MDISQTVGGYLSSSHQTPIFKSGVRSTMYTLRLDGERASCPRAARTPLRREFSTLPARMHFGAWLPKLPEKLSAEGGGGGKNGKGREGEVGEEIEKRNVDGRCMRIS